MTSIMTVLLTFGKILAITPFNPSKRLFQKIHATVILSLFTYANVVPWINNKFYSKFNIMKQIIYLLSDFTLILFNVTTAKAAFSYKKWEKLQQKRRKNNSKASVLWMVVTNLIVCWFLGFEFHRLIKTMDFQYFFVEILRLLQTYTKCAYTSLVWEFLHVLREQYQVLATMVRSARIKDTKNEAYFLKHTVDYSNDVFGWSFGLFLLETALYVLKYLDKSFLSQTNENIFFWMTLINVAVVSCTASAPMILIWMWDLVLKEADNCLHLSFGLEENELVELSAFLKESRPKFSAANFVDIDKSTILQLWWSVFTFFICLVQFSTVAIKS